jgi:AraC-like DNA-binding protein
MLPLRFAAGLNKRDMLRPKLVRPRGILDLRADAALTGYARYWPSDDLSHFVEHLWTVEWGLDQPTVREVLTHPSVQLVVERGDSRVAGVCTTRYVRRFEGSGRVLGVKFRPGGFRTFYQRPVSGLTDRALAITEVFGRAAAGLEQRALAHPAHAEAFAVIEKFLRGRRPQADENVELVGRITERAATDRSIVRVDQLAREFDVGLRKLQRLFDDYVGVSPKWVIQRYRLHEAAERIANGTVTDFAALALDVGYADQAHFIRDFRKLVGRTPAQYARTL